MNRDRIVEYAAKYYKKQQAFGNTGYTVEDAVVYALEENDTGYDLTEIEWKQLDADVAKAVQE